MDTLTYSASDARQNFYQLVRHAASGLKPVEINLRGADSVVMINKSEVESWLETLDLLSSKKETSFLKKSLKNKILVSHHDLKNELGL